MANKISLAVLISGNGSNLQAIIDNIKNQKLMADIKIVISNNIDAPGLEKAKASNIKTTCINHKNFKSRELFDDEIIKEIEDQDVDLIVLAGFMRVLSSKFVNKYKRKIINIHPSLLPKYPGLNTHEKVIENNDIEHGVTVHLVEEGLDSGPIIGFAKLKIHENEDEESLKKRIHKLEHFIYPKIISEIQEKKIKIENKIYHEGNIYKHGKEFFI